MRNTGRQTGKEPRRLPAERRGLGFFSSVLVFLLMCALSGSLLIASISASEKPPGTLVDVGALVHAVADLMGENDENADDGQSDANDNATSQRHATDGSDPANNSDPAPSSNASPSAASTDPNEEPVVDEAELSKGYYYNQLNDKKKKEYAQVYKMASTRSAVEFPSNDGEEMGLIFKLVSGDHPEFFYIEGISSTSSSGVTSATIEGRYCYPDSKIDSLTQSVDAAVDACIAGVPANADDFAKAKYVYDYLIQHVAYSHKTFSKLDSLPYEKAGQNVVSSLVDGKCVCAGYAHAFQLIMQRMGFTCAYVEGQLTEEDGSHAWCLLQLDGDYYYVDPTWGDHDSNTKDKSVRKWEWSNYGYLCVTTDDMHRSRIAADYQPLPDCSATADNYYVRAKRLLKKPKIATVVKWGNKVLAKGKTYFQFRCANQAVYEQVRDSMSDAHFDGDPAFRYIYHDDVFNFEVVFD